MSPADASGTDPALSELAERLGVALTFRDGRGEERRADEPALRAVLDALGVDLAGGPAAALERHHAARRARRAPPASVARQGRPAALRLRPPRGERLDVVVELEEGGRRELATGVGPGDGGEAEVTVPDDLPPGYHLLRLRAPGDAAEGGGGSAGPVGPGDADVAERDDLAHLIVAPPTAPPAPERRWGWTTQLYAMRSADSWGVGDLGDLRRLAMAGAEDGADFAVVNPLHARVPVEPLGDSPYSPSTRRFVDPLHLDVDAVAEVRAVVDEEERARLRAAAWDAERIDRAAVRDAKLDALERAFAALPSERQRRLAAFRRERGAPLEAFATFCAIAERHGLPFRSWPAELRHPASPAVAELAAEAADRVSFHAWLQLLCDEQLADAQEDARAAGMRLGVVHDLAVGVDTGGADAWSLPDVLGRGVTVGAPPDAFNPRGQDWSQPPFLPQRLLETGMRPLREVLGASLRHAGGLRIDHVLGLFRLYWIPEGRSAAEGTYVDYPTEAMLATVALEAHRAGAVVIGEDLGTVAPGVREALAEERVLRSSVLWFERDEAGRLRPPHEYPAAALASVSTHDLPTAAGWWHDDEIAVRERLGILGEGADPVAERETKRRQREELAGLLRAEGLVADEAGVDELVVAMHALLARARSALVAVALGDAVGDRRQPNLPGTVDAYPNWRLPLADGAGRPLLLDEAMAHPLLRRCVEAVRTQRN